MQSGVFIPILTVMFEALLPIYTYTYIPIIIPNINKAQKRTENIFCKDINCQKNKNKNKNTANTLCVLTNKRL